jgi:hypothetical protein
MTFDIDAFVNNWVYDVRRVLERRLDSLRYDLDSDDEGVRDKARKQIPEIEAWLYPPAKPLPDEEKVRRTRDALGDGSLSPQERLAAARRVARSTGRPRGRPRTETAQHAIRALSLHLATPMSWREIALIVKGCNHKRPSSERSCRPCGDAIRDAVGRLEEFLRAIGCHPEFPRSVELDKMSYADLTRLFGPLD